jgi:GNAT superfamily N-acetyltransferase
MSRTVRHARSDDHDAVAAFTRDTWPDRDIGDYVLEAFPEWVATDGPDQYTAVATVDGDPVAVAQARLLTSDEAWFQGLRVHRSHRGEGHALALADRLCDWSRERGATVARLMVFGWNDGGIGQSRAAGFLPGPACRWVRPRPVDTAETASRGGASAAESLDVRSDADAAWRFWTQSDARTALDGLALDDDVTWALAELTRDRFRRLADDGRALAVVGDRTRAATVRLGTRETDGETVADYAVAAWADPDAARALLDAIRTDAAGADATRVPIPETTRCVSDAALARAPLSDQPVYVFTRDLTGRAGEA